MRDLHAESATECQVVELCGLLGVSKQAYYQYDEDAVHAKAAREEFALQYILDIRKEDPGIGGKKLWYMYRREQNKAMAVFNDIVGILDVEWKKPDDPIQSAIGKDGFFSDSGKQLHQYIPAIGFRETFDVKVKRWSRFSCLQEFQRERH